MKSFALAAVLAVLSLFAPRSDAAVISKATMDRMPAHVSGMWYSTDVENEAVVIETGVSHQFVYFLTHTNGSRDWYVAIDTPTALFGRNRAVYTFVAYREQSWGDAGNPKPALTMAFVLSKDDPTSMNLTLTYEPGTPACPTAKKACVSTRTLYQLTSPPE